MPGDNHTLTKLVYRLSVDAPTPEQIEGTLQIIRKRLSAFGLEGTATTAGRRSNSDRTALMCRAADLVKRIIGETARLEFQVSARAPTPAASTLPTPRSALLATTCPEPMPPQIRLALVG